jgi:hypothetical protein
VPGKKAVKFLWTKNCHLIPLKGSITGSFDLVIAQVKRNQNKGLKTNSIKIR